MTARPRPRPVPYELAVYVVSADEWNRSPTRRHFAESSCPAGCFVVFAETTARAGVDDGIALVAHYEAWSSIGWAIEQSVTQMASMMDDKFGAEFWRPAGEPAVYTVGLEAGPPPPRPEDGRSSEGP